MEGRIENLKKYDLFMDQWLLGLEEELGFWNNLLKTKGAFIHAEKDFLTRISPDTVFFMEDWIEQHFSGANPISFLDVGSGPYSNCGWKSKRDIDFYAIDPLAEGYNILKEKYNIYTPVNPKTGFVEMLSDKFKENTFDIVHMSNALDHSFDPLNGIAQMLYVCKPDGIVVLRHTKNEAINESYRGLHQWNIDLEDGSFILWNQDHYLRVNDHIKNHSEIVFAGYDNENEHQMDSWKYIKIIIKKKKQFEKPIFKYREIFLEKLMIEIMRLRIEKDE